MKKWRTTALASLHPTTVNQPSTGHGKFLLKANRPTWSRLLKATASGWQKTTPYPSCLLTQSPARFWLAGSVSTAAVGLIKPRSQSKATTLYRKIRPSKSAKPLLTGLKHCHKIRLGIKPRPGCTATPLSWRTQLPKPATAR